MQSTEVLFEDDEEELCETSSRRIVARAVEALTAADPPLLVPAAAEAPAVAHAVAVSLLAVA
jgi:hypothetical protein